MALLKREPEPELAAIGRKHQALAEVRYEDGVDDWWHQGHLVVAEAGDVESVWDPATQQWTFAAETDLGKDKWVAAHDELADGGSERSRRKLRHRVYYFEDLDKADRRYLHTADLDLIQSAPQIPYTQTEKGAARFQLIFTLAMGSIDVLMLLVMISVISSPVATASTAEAASGFIYAVVQVVAWPISLLVLYYVMGRRTQVLVIDLRPVATRVGSPKNELVYLTNSHKEPAAAYLRRIYGLPSAAIEEFGQIVAKFQTETIQRLQEQLHARDEDLDRYKLAGERNTEQRIDLAVLSQPSAAPPKTNWGVVAAIVVVSCTLTGMLVYLALISGA